MTPSMINWVGELAHLYYEIGSIREMVNVKTR